MYAIANDQKDKLAFPSPYHFPFQSLCVPPYSSAMNRWMTGGHEPVSPHTAELENSGNRLQITSDPMACFTAKEAGRESVTLRLTDSTSFGEIGPANVLEELQEPKQDKESSLRDRGSTLP